MNLTEYAAMAGVALGIAIKVVAACSAIAAITPNQTDNKIVDGIAKVINFFAFNFGFARNEQK